MQGVHVLPKNKLNLKQFILFKGNITVNNTAADGTAGIQY